MSYVPLIDIGSLDLDRLASTANALLAGAQANPLAAAFVAAVTTLMIYGLNRLTHGSPAWLLENLVSYKQFDFAAPSAVQALLASAQQIGRRGFVEGKLEELWWLRPGGLRYGQLWWTWWQVRGLVDADVPAPACLSHATGLEPLRQGRVRRRASGGSHEEVVTLDLRRWLQAGHDRVTLSAHA